MTRTPGKSTPWGQSYRIAFFTLYGAAIIAACGWLFSSIYPVAPDSRAIVFRFGKPVRVEGAGLLFAWPYPIERVEQVLGAERILGRDVLVLQRERQLDQVNSWERDGDAGAGAGYLLTGDAGVVQLNVRVFWHVSDPVRFALQRPHIDPLIDRLAERAATVVCEGRDLDSILVTRPEALQNDSHAAQERAQLRSDFRQAMARSLTALASGGNDPGIRIDRVDITSSLPQDAVAAFNAVLAAGQQADQTIASARTAAALRILRAQQQSDRLLQQAQAYRQEALAQANIDTRTILQLAQARREGLDGGLLQRLWRDKVTRILAQAGQVITVTSGDDSRLILQGGSPAPIVNEKKP
ncbi:protease modulator HflK [Enterobacter wuhouensis]|uniref:protease modulator HflK n=1 Tax=Enterobacter wuhouensis TaxID=2529381 RepID=UPI002FD534FA